MIIASWFKMPIYVQSVILNGVLCKHWSMIEKIMFVHKKGRRNSQELCWLFESSLNVKHFTN